MAKRCTRCGNFLMDDERFCTRCGENVSNIPPQGAVPGQDNAFGRNDGYVSPSAPPNQMQPVQPNPYAQQYNTYAAPVHTNPEEMSLGKWVLTIIVTTFFGIISLVFLFIWGFGDGPESRKNYCKAMLIVDLISIGIGIIFMVLFFGAIATSMSDYLSQSREWLEEYGQYTAAQLAAFIGR